MKTLIAAVIGAASMGVVSAAAYAVTQRTDPSLGKLGRNSQIASALAIAVGLYVAKKKNMLYGAVIATSGAALLLSTKIASFLGGLLNKPTTPAIAAIFGNMGAYSRQMSGAGAVYRNLGGVSGYTRQMAAVGAAGRSRGFVPPAPWRGTGPF